MIATTFIVAILWTDAVQRPLLKHLRGVQSKANAGTVKRTVLSAMPAERSVAA
jgi:hypothetical protein